MNVFASYPRSGRAWTISMFREIRRAGIRFEFRHTHDDAGDYCIHRYKKSKFRWRGHKVLLVARDPRDVVVSHWHILKHRTKRFRQKWGDMSLFDWIQTPEGIDFPIRFLNDWRTQIDVPSFRIMHYEDMKRDVVSEMTKALRFFGALNKADRGKVDVVKFVTPQAMRTKFYPHSDWKPDARGNAVRRAESGVWHEYFSDSEIDWIMDQVQRLDCYYQKYKQAPCTI